MLCKSDNVGIMAPTQASARASADYSENQESCSMHRLQSLSNEHPVGAKVKPHNTLMQKSWRLPSVLTTVDGYLAKDLSRLVGNTCKLVESRLVVAAILASVASSTTHVVAFLDQRDENVSDKYDFHYHFSELT
jgi:hypothetical protein